MTSSAVVKRYASALVDIVVSSSAGIEPARALQQLRAFDAAVRSTPELRIVLASPSVSTVRKRQVIRRIADALGLERILKNFLLVLSDHRRAGALSEMLDGFDLLLDERLGYVRVDIRTAAELGREQREQLTGELGKLAGAKVRTRFTVDPDLIGGVTARLGSKVYDGSVRAQLQKLERRLAAI
jgi:F-type H+-transporting ATPase subunit delta